MKFNEKLQQLRKDKGITQEELAQAIYVTRAAVSKWERGLGIPSKESLKLLCDFFNVKSEELLDSYELIDENQKNKNSKKKLIILFSSIIILLTIFFSILLIALNNKNNDTPTTITKYASVVGLDENFLHVETINQDKKVVIEYILLTDIIDLTEKNDKEIQVNNLNENDYIELTITDGKYDIRRIETAVDNALDEKACGFVISFFEQKEINIKTDFINELNYIYYLKHNYGMSSNYDYFKSEYETDDEGVIIKKMSINYNNTATSSNQLYVYSLIPTENNNIYLTKLEQTYNLYNDQLVSFTILGTKYNSDYSIGYRHNNRMHYQFNFVYKTHIEINTIYQYNENLDLISKTTIIDNKGIKILDDAVYVLAEYTKISKDGTSSHKDNYEVVLSYNPFYYDYNKLMWVR